MISADTFRPSRADGRSAQQVILDLIGDPPPGAVFTYDQIADALADGGREYTRREVQQATRLANFRLERERRRTLVNLRGVGYRVAHAREHVHVAGSRTSRANNQARWALRTMESVRLDEMTEQERVAHLAQQSFNHAMYDITRRIRRQQREQERALKAVAGKVEGLAGRLDRANL